jgi:phosphoketolase
MGDTLTTAPDLQIMKPFAAVTGSPLTSGMRRRIDPYRRAANYLSVGEIYFLDNPLLSEPLQTCRKIRSSHWKATG